MSVLYIILSLVVLLILSVGTNIVLFKRNKDKIRLLNVEKLEHGITKKKLNRSERENNRLQTAAKFYYSRYSNNNNI